MVLFREFSLSLTKEIRAALIDIYGVGWYKAILVTTRLGLSIPYYITNINDFRFRVLSNLLKGFVLSDARIKRIYTSNISLKIDLKGYQGIRHNLSLPLHGQRTRTNARTRKYLKFNLINK